MLTFLWAIPITFWTPRACLPIAEPPRGLFIRTRFLHLIENAPTSIRQFNRSEARVSDGELEKSARTQDAINLSQSRPRTRHILQAHKGCAKIESLRGTGQLLQRTRSA
jgi:hypothetical protein